MRKSFGPLLLVLLLSSSVTAFTPAPQIGSSGSVSSVAPTFGPQGTVVTIRGAGLCEPGARWAKGVAGDAAPGRVTFNGTPAEIVFWSEDLITVRVPAGASTGPLRVSLADGQSLVAVRNFDVYYSTPAAPSRSEQVEQEPEQRYERREPDAPDRFEQERYSFDPWFSRLSTGERTYLAEHGPDALWFGSPFMFGGRNSRSFDRGFFSPFGRGFNGVGSRQFFFGFGHRGINFNRGFRFFWRWR